MKIFQNQGEGCLAVLYQPLLKRFKSEIPDGVKMITVDDQGNSPGIGLLGEGKNLIYISEKGEKQIFDLTRFPLIGKHNIRNAVFAAAGAMHFGAHLNLAWKSLLDFEPLPHRLEKFHEWQGIDFVDDSKSTTPSSTLEAVNSFEGPVYLILGGRAKGADFDILKQMPKERICGILLIGETSLALQDLLKDVFPVTSVGTLLQAVEQSMRNAKAGDVVLLSPACASFDMFENYKARGETFKKIVRQIAA